LAKKGDRMAIKFSGCRNVSITGVDPFAGGIDAPLTRFKIDGAGPAYDGVYPGSPAGFSLHVVGHGNTPWSVTVQYKQPFGGAAWVNSPVQVTNTPLGTEIRAIDPGDNPQSADLVLFCAFCEQLPIFRVPSDSTWVSWGVQVDAGGPTGRGPVPPWSPFLRDFASGLALAEAAQLLHTDLRASALELAAKQISAASADIVKVLTNG